MSSRTATKNCKVCITEIARRAKVCPHCQRPQTFLASTKETCKAGVWFLAACLSLAVAVLEKVEKSQIAKELLAQHIDTEVMKDLLTDLSNQTESFAHQSEVLWPTTENSGQMPDAGLAVGSSGHMPEPAQDGSMPMTEEFVVPMTGSTGHAGGMTGRAEAKPSAASITEKMKEIETELEGLDISKQREHYTRLKKEWFELSLQKRRAK